jgi:hypothetical protein
MAQTRSLAELEFMEYRKLKELLDYSPSNGLYEELMKREASVLKTVNRIVDHSNKRELEAKELLNLPMGKIGAMFYKNMYEMFDEMTNVKTTDDVVAMFKGKTDRMIYAGAAIVIVSLFLYFVSITN